MSKDKLKRFKENESFANLIQQKIIFPPVDHKLKGKWKKDFFKNDNPIILELGCGRGEYTINLANIFPQRNFIGIDWKGARLWRGAKTGTEEKMLNVGFLRIQIQNINAFFAPDEVDEIWVTFPDPQMEKGRERKRLTSLRFLNYYRKFMVKDGIVNLKTDSKPFYDYTMEVIRDEKLKVLFSTDDLYSEIKNDDTHPQALPSLLSIKTTYEKIWLKEGAKICFVSFKINNDEGE